MQRRSLLRLAAASTTLSTLGLAAPALRAQGSLTPLRFTLDFRITGQVAPFLLAQSKGYFKDEGLDVAIDVGNGSVASITRVASGAYDMGFGDISALMEFASKNTDAPAVKAVYQYYNRAPFAIIGRRDHGLTPDFKSLQGKRIAAAAVESTRRAWPMVARRLGMPAEPFEWVTTDFSQRDNVIVRGDVDGATYFHDSAVSLFQRIPQDQLSVLSYADAGVHLYGNAVLASLKMISERPQHVAGFVRALNRALIETLHDPAEALAATKARETMLQVPVEQQRWAITAGYVTATDTKQHGLGAIDPKVAAGQAADVAAVYGLARQPDAATIYDLSFLPPLAERQAPGGAA